MRQEIVMPQLGLTMTEGAVAAWMKKPGDKVQRGDILFLVQTDKVEMEVESFVSGFLDDILVEPEVVVKVGTVIATVDDGRVATPSPAAVNQVAPQPSLRKVKPEADVQPAQGAAPRTIPVSPRARKMAGSLGVDLALVSPSNGIRIVEEDVRTFHERGAKVGASSAEAIKGTGFQPGGTGSQPGRAVLAQRMTSSFQSAPHFYLTAHVDVSKLVELRNSIVSVFQERHGVKVTYTDFFLRALAVTLREKPEVNSFWAANQVEQRGGVDLSLATQTQHGLLTPVIESADKLDFAELAKRRSALIEKARARKLTLKEMEGGSATLSNLGTHKIDEFHAILNPPQSVILAAGQIAKRPLVVDGNVEARSTVFLTVSADHRVLDGVSAAKFLDRIRELLENPYGLLL